MEADKQRGSIVLTKQNIDGQDYIRMIMEIIRLLPCCFPKIVELK